MSNNQSTTLISAKNLIVKRSKRNILNDVSLDIGPQDFTTIIGPNGAGKSMLLKCLMGFYQADEGTVTRKKNLNIGYVPQRLIPDHTMPITVRGFLALRKKANRQTIEAIAQETNITERLDDLLYVLSGGELQRVLLGRALLDNPELLVLDEPAQNLDVTGQLAFYKLIEHIYKQRQLSILMVSHDLHLVMACTKRVICLYHHICCSGHPQAVAQDPEFKTLFGDDMAKMVAVYHHSHDHQHTEGCNHD